MQFQQHWRSRLALRPDLDQPPADDRIIDAAKEACPRSALFTQALMAHLVWFLPVKVGGAYGPLATKGLPEPPRATQSLPGQPEGPDEGALKAR